MLIEEYAFLRTSNFEAKEIFEMTEIFSFEMGGENSLESLDLRDVVTSNQDVININKNNSNASLGDKSK